jgi:hypothetical protein
MKFCGKEIIFPLPKSKITKHYYYSSPHLLLAGDGEADGAIIYNCTSRILLVCLAMRTSSFAFVKRWTPPQLLFFHVRSFALSAIIGIPHLSQQGCSPCGISPGLIARLFPHPIHLAITHNSPRRLLFLRIVFAILLLILPPLRSLAMG